MTGLIELEQPVVSTPVENAAAVPLGTYQGLDHLSWECLTCGGGAVAGQKASVPAELAFNPLRAR